LWAGAVTAPDVAGPTEWTQGPGVGPWPGPPPDDARYDAELLRTGDTRNVVDAYRYWSREAIIADIDGRRHRLHVAIENFGNDANIGAVVRTANAFAVDNVPGAMRLEHTALPRDCLLIFGQEGPGITEDARAGAAVTVSIAQFGSTRSINAAVAAGIAMHTWIVHWGDLSRAW